MTLIPRVIVVVAAATGGWWVGTEIGILGGVAIDKATSNEFVSWALLTIPLGGLLGSIAGILIALWAIRRLSQRAKRRSN